MALLSGLHVKTSWQATADVGFAKGVTITPLRDSSSLMRLTALLCGPQVKTFCRLFDEAPSNSFVRTSSSAGVQTSPYNSSDRDTETFLSGMALVNKSANWIHAEQGLHDIAMAD
ncbi:hypothetical protein Tco_1392202 [Tanacetum coccineum]